MQSIYFWIFAVAVSESGVHQTFDDSNMPTIVVDISIGESNRVRIDHLHAEIHHKHLTTNERVNFPTGAFPSVQIHFLEDD